MKKVFSGSKIVKLKAQVIQRDPNPKVSVKFDRYASPIFSCADLYRDFWRPLEYREKILSCNHGSLCKKNVEL